MSARGGASVAYADTSLFLALLAGPSHPLHDEALELFRRVSEGQLSLIVTPMVVAELVWSAKSVLRWSRADTATRLAAMLESDGLQVRELPVIQAALQLYREHPRLDYPDAYLAATAALTGPAAVASFDRAFGVIEGIARITA